MTPIDEGYQRCPQCGWSACDCVDEDGQCQRCAGVGCEACDVRASMETLVFQAIGEASMCWENPSCAGVFDSAHAAHIGEALLAQIRSYIVGASLSPK